MSKNFLFQAIQFTQTIQFSISMLLVLFNPQMGPLSGATTPGHSGPESNGKKGVLRTPQSSSIAGTSPSDCLVSYLGHSLGGVLPLCREAVGVFYSPSRLGNLKRETESLLIEKQNNAIRTNYIKAIIDRTQQNSKCWLCGDRDETINHTMSECSK